MLIEFTTKNFRSFKDEATLSLVAESLGNNATYTFNIGNDTELLPAVGIFGPNASGKSNLLKALFFLKLSIENTNYLNIPVFANPLFQPFMLDSKSDKEPSFFQIVLWDKDSGSEYRYGFEVTKKEIVSEWLIETSKAKKNMTTKTLFTREGSDVKVNKIMDKSPEALIKKIHPNSLALTVFATFANPFALRVFNLIKDKLFISDGTFDLGPLNQIAFEVLQQNPHLKEPLLKFLKATDVAIADLVLERKSLNQSELQQVMQAMPPGLVEAMGQQELFNNQILTTHKMNGSEQTATFNMAEFESIGTQRLFGLGTLILHVLDKGGTIVIDEFGNSLHPFLSSEIIKIFQNKKTNPKNAQLVFSSHETFLLSSKGPNLRRDQIWFTEKDKSEKASLHSLAEYKTKNDLEVAKNYLEGRFGAVPVTTFED